MFGHAPFGVRPFDDLTVTVTSTTASSTTLEGTTGRHGKKKKPGAQVTFDRGSAADWTFELPPEAPAAVATAPAAAPDDIAAEDELILAKVHEILHQLMEMA